MKHHNMMVQFLKIKVLTFLTLSTCQQKHSLSTLQTKNIQKQETNSLSVQNFISNSTVSTIVLLIQRSVLLISAGFCGFWESLVTSQVTKKKHANVRVKLDQMHGTPASLEDFVKQTSGIACRDSFPL